MKYIKKQGAPAKYLTWCKKTAGTNEEDYRNLRNPEKDCLKKVLLKEQGFLCAYTQRRISLPSSHIEHIKPESLCRKEKVGSDLDYNNMVACYPRDGMKNPYRYGAPLKDDWWENEGKEFVSPLNKTCEKRFLYTKDGNILPVDNHASATKTIEILNLNHPSLVEDRKNVIKEFIYGQTGDFPLSPKKTLKAIDEIYNLSNEGQLKAYCVAIHHGLEEHKRILEKIAKKKKYIGSKDKKKK